MILNNITKDSRFGVNAWMRTKQKVLKISTPRSMKLSEKNQKDLRNRRRMLKNQNLLKPSSLTRTSMRHLKVNSEKIGG